MSKRKNSEASFSVEAFYQRLQHEQNVKGVRASYTGTSHPKIMVVSDYASDSGQPLVRDDYSFFTKANTGRMSQTYLTTLRKSKYIDDRTLSNILFDEIEYAKPLLVISFGTDASRVLRRKSDLNIRTIFQSGLGIIHAVQCPNGMWFRHAILEAPSTLHSDFAKNAWMVNFEHALKGVDRARIEPFPEQILPNDQVQHCIAKPESALYCPREPRSDENVGELYVTQILYQAKDNTFSVIGKTDAGASVHVKVRDFKFDIYVEHAAVKTYSDAQIKSINDALNIVMREEQCGPVLVERQLRRPIIHHFPEPIPFLRFRLTQWADRHKALQLYQDAVDDAIKVYECNSLTPVKKFMLDRNVYSHGWVRFNRWERSFDNYRADYCLQASVNDMEAFCPNPGEKLVDEKWTRYASFTKECIDIECLGNTGFFDPAEGSIVSVSAARLVMNDAQRPLEIEELRDLNKPDGIETCSTGRSNYTHVSTFVLGDVASPRPGDPFSTKYLPNVPNPPRTTPRLIEDPVKKQYCIREWNAYLVKYEKWLRLVGTRRRDHLFSSCAELGHAFSQLTRCRDWQNISETWHAIVETIVARWSKRVLDDIADFPVSRATHSEHAEECEHALGGDTYSGGLISQHAGGGDTHSGVETEEWGAIESKWHVFHPDCAVFSFKTERDLLVGFATYIAQSDPDAIVGYNVGFDFDGIMQRMHILGVEQNLTRFPDNPGSCKRKQKHSNQAGGRSYIETALPGRDNSDLMPYFKDKKLGATTLNAVCTKFLGMTKYEMAYSQIEPYLFDPDRRGFLCDYNYWDVILPHCLGIHCGIHMFLIAMCRITTLLFVSDVYNKGQESKVLSQYLRKAKTLDGLNYTIHDFNCYSAEDVPEIPGQKKQKYTGAYVPPSIKGLVDELILKIDFKSLYPSLAIAQNCGQNTYIPGATNGPGFIQSKEPVSLTSPNDPKEYISMLKPPELSEAPEGVPCRKNKNGTFTPLVDLSILALTLIDGLAARQEVKSRADKCEPGSWNKFTLGVLELVIKFLNNSAYGVSGKDKGPMALMGVAEMITTAGRHAIMDCIHRLETVFGATIVGGDTDSAFVIIPGIDTHEALFKPYELNGVTKPFYDHFMEVVNKDLPPPMELDFEGVMGGGFKLGKNGEKLYESNLFHVKKHRAVYEHTIIRDPITGERKVNPVGYLSIKGMAAGRRDFNAFTRSGLNKVIDVLTHSKGIKQEAFKQCFDIVKGSVTDLVEKRVPAKELIETRQYSKKNPKVQLASNEIVKRLEKRGDPNTPALGDRVAFINAKTRKMERDTKQTRNKKGINVIKAGRLENAKACEKAVDVIEFAHSDREIDVEYMLDKLKGAMRPLVSLGYEGDRIVFGGGEVALNNKMNELFRHKPISSRERVSKDNVLFTKFGFTVSAPCGMCRKQSMTPLCSDCAQKPEEEHQKFRASLVQDIEDCSAQCWTCMRVAPGTKVVCNDLSCAHQIDRGRAEYKLEVYEKAAQ